MESFIGNQEDVVRGVERCRSNFKKTPKDRLTCAYIEVRLEKLKRSWELFNFNHMKSYLPFDITEHNGSRYVKNAVYDEFQELCSDYETELREKLQAITQYGNKGNSKIRHEETDNAQTVKLPKITIPMFSGKYEEWTSFRDLFISLVHNNGSLDDVQRLHYLKSHLMGEAEQLLRHIPVTAANYVVSWSQIEKRYNNKRYLCNETLKRFMGQKNLSNETASGIKGLLDTTNECLNSLHNLNIETNSWDVIVIYIVSLKLDIETRKQWEAKSSENQDLPTLTQFTDFLEQRFRSLEFLEFKEDKPNIRISKTLHVTSEEGESSQVLCSYCKEPHKLINCKKFTREEIATRQDFVQVNGLCSNCLGPNHFWYACRHPSRCHVCKKKHHTLLHGGRPKKNASDTVTQSESTSDKVNVSAVATKTDPELMSPVIACHSNGMLNQVILATALVRVVETGSNTILRSLLDQGSQASFITEAAAQGLGLKKIPNKSVISGLGSEQGSAMKSNSIVVMKIQSLHDPEFMFEITAHVIGKITSLIPERKANIESWPELLSIKLADPTFDKPNKIDLLLGAEVYAHILEQGLIKGPAGTPVAQQTKLGWILSGPVSQQEEHHHYQSHRITLHAQVKDDELLKFWELEAEPIQTHTLQKLTEEEQRCEDIFAKTTTRDEDGRYVVRLPFRDTDPQCQYGRSLKIASRRYKLAENRLLKNAQLNKQYTEGIQEYIDLGHIEYVPEENINNDKAVYLPQVIVVREDRTTTKVRVCFDASCPGINGVSLNNDLMIGPKLQLDLRHIIMKWRLHPICLIADIVKMYRQIKVSKEDVDFQRLLWRPDVESELQHLRLLRVTFGTASAPYLAVKALQQVALDEGAKYSSQVAEKVLHDFYMDDLMTGCQTVEEGRVIYNDMKEMLNKGGFELQKWSSNSENVLDIINEDKKDITDNKDLKPDEVHKILGLTWNRKTDEFCYSVKLPPLTVPVTKRKALSDISKLFDPLGWLAPTIIIAKVFIQKIWITRIGWDEELPNDLLKEWMTFRESLVQLEKSRTPRWMETKKDDVYRELHGFSDASIDAYSAVVYLRVVDGEGIIHCNLVTAKTKVSPIKQVSIARLELCGAGLVTKLLIEVSEVLGIHKNNIHAWTDSTIVLYWLSSLPRRWKTFVANRVADIQNNLEFHHWSHVRSQDNPADCAARGLSPTELLESKLWTEGPYWLKDETIDYRRPEIHATKLEERKVVHCMTANIAEEPWSRFSKLRRLLRVLALCKRFAASCQKKKAIPHWITTNELSEILEQYIKTCQSQHFSKELTSIRDSKAVHKKSSIKSLNPFLDQQGILRVGGRLQHAELTENMKHPILIPRKSHLTDLLIAEAHERTFHGGPQLMMNYVRTKYWITDVKRLTKLFVRKCVRCVRRAARISSQLMGQLPEARVTPSRPFLRSGVDYAGPISVRISKGRGIRCSKGYICLFVCMSTKAIHLEAVSDLTAHGFINAFRRLVARRGHCEELWSDNGTNFVGAAKELKKLFMAEKSSMAVEIADLLATNGTKWHFIPPHSPNFGGLWEAGIKSTKNHLKKVIGNATLTYEELSTVLTQIEACLNSRPMSQLSNHPDDLGHLTPGHFLVGEPLVTVPDRNYENENINSLRRWKLTQRMVQEFWRRWSQEYLSHMLHRYKWAYQTPEPAVGDIVLVKEDDLPPAKWLYGLVVDKHPGMDGITRVVTIRCNGKLIKRPTSKICILPIQTENTDS